MGTYKILRYFRKEGKKPKVIRTGLSLEQAKEWCNKKSTSKKDEWFDGFTKE